MRSCILLFKFMKILINKIAKDIKIMYSNSVEVESETKKSYEGGWVL